MSAPAPPAPPPDGDALARGVLGGDRRALARAITLVESTRDDHRDAAEALLHALLPHTGRGIRLGITGTPGVGKSTFIEAFGRHVVDRGHRLAVLAVDPSSPRSGGSILGDKTRMERLAHDPRAFIRPSPSGGALGGVARRTREAMLVCEAAGYDVVVVETVGVGQSETAVADMVDMFLLLLVPGGGDELQGIKRGIVELADAIVVTKADGDLAADAARARHEYANALRLLSPTASEWSVPVLTCSALAGQGIDAVWETVGRYRDGMTASGRFAERRASQARARLWGEVSETLLAELRRDPAIAALLPGLERDVAAQILAPGTAARRIMAALRGR